MNSSDVRGRSAGKPPRSFQNRPARPSTSPSPGTSSSSDTAPEHRLDERPLRLATSAPDAPHREERSRERHLRQRDLADCSVDALGRRRDRERVALAELVGGQEVVEGLHSCACAPTRHVTKRRKLQVVTCASGPPPPSRSPVGEPNASSKLQLVTCCWARLIRPPRRRSSRLARRPPRSSRDRRSRGSRP